MPMCFSSGNLKFKSDHVPGHHTGKKKLMTAGLLK